MTPAQTPQPRAAAKQDDSTFGAWLDDHRFTVDAAVAWSAAIFTALFGSSISAEFGIRTAQDVPDPTTAAIFSFAVVFPLAWRRVRPVGSAVAVYAIALLHFLLGYSLIFPGDLAVIVALYSVTAFGPRWAGTSAIIGAEIGALLTAMWSVPNSYSGSAAGQLWNAFSVFILATGLCLSAWAVGQVRSSRRLRAEAIEARAAQLEIDRERQDRISAQAERARIAREMHDIVAHSLSVIIAQADGGRYAAQASPEAAGRALTTISETGRAALADMRRILGVLRPTDDATAEFKPQPEADDIEGLISRTRAAGMAVSFVTIGAPRQLPPGAGLTVFRICQESLTNVLKHAGPDPTVTVMVRWTSMSIQLEVSDDGRGAASSIESDGRGQGLLGMRERAALFGGTVTAGPRPGGGYVVRATIPTPPASSPAGAGPAAPTAASPQLPPAQPWPHSSAALAAPSATAPSPEPEHPLWGLGSYDTPTRESGTS